MNAKTCKKLRKLTKFMLDGFVSTAYNDWQLPVFQPSKFDLSGEPTQFMKVGPGIPCEVVKTCSRGAYRLLKKKFKNDPYAEI